MNQKVIRVFRIILYTAAVYLLVDMFFLSSGPSAPQLKQLSIPKGMITTEYYVSINDQDSLWYILQTAPSPGVARKAGKTGPWDEPSSVWQQLNQTGRQFIGFYVRPDYALDAASFQIIRSRIDSMKNLSSPTLSRFHRGSPVTLIFK